MWHGERSSPSEVAMWGPRQPALVHRGLGSSPRTSRARRLPVIGEMLPVPLVTVPARIPRCMSGATTLRRKEWGNELHRQQRCFGG